MIAQVSRQRLHQIRFPERSKARQAVTTAIRSGNLPRPGELRCNDCDQYAQEYDHYLGYATEHRLDVQPVCIKCHQKRPQSARINARPPKARIIRAPKAILVQVQPREQPTERPKICPVCGSTAGYLKVRKDGTIVCSACGARTPRKD